MYGGRGTDAYRQAMNNKSAEYGDKAQGTDSLEKELVAEFTRTQLSNEGVVERIVKENRNVATKILAALKKAYTNIKNKLQGKETNLSDMEKAINLFEKALAENRKMSFTEAVVRGNTNTGPYIDDESMVQFSDKGSGEKQYAIETLPDGKKYVQADRQVMFSSNPDSWGEDLENYVNDEIRKGKDVKVTSEDGNILTITSKTAWKLGDRNEVKMPDGTKRLMTDDEYATKLTAGSHIDEIAQLLKGNDKYVPDTKDHDFAKDGFTYKNAFFRDFDGTYYRLGVSIGKSGEIKSIYNIGILDKRSFPSTGSSSPKGGAQNVGKASKNNIPHQKAIVNNNDMQKSQNNAQGGNGKQHLLGGETSVVANNKTLAEARRMNLKGEPQAEIFKKTGWYKGVDKRWRYEIPDDNARFVRKGDLVFKKDHPDYERYRELLDIQNRYILEMEGGRELTETEKKEYEKLKNIWNGTFTQNGKVTPDAGTQDRLEAYFDHPELYEAYPQLKDLKIVFNKDYDGYGEYRPDIKTIVVREGLDNEFAEKVLLHEVQHAIQDIEGFEIGSNREEALENVRAEAATELINIKDKEFAQAKTVQEVNSVIDRNLIKWYNSIYGNVKTIEDVAYRAYLDYYGEREAREVVERAKMSSEERKRTFPEREYLIKPFTKGNYNENSRQNQTLYSSQNSNVSNKTQKEKSIEIHGTQKQHLLGAEVTEETKIEAPEYNSTAKSRTRLERYENEAVRKVADAMSVRLGTAREFLKPIIQEMSTEYMKTGKLSQETVDRLFEEAYKNGKIVNDEAYKGYADLRNYLRNTKIYFDSEAAADIPDFFKDIRRYMGRLSVSSTSGTSVDSIYQELNEMHPSLFPEDILSSSDRMLRIMEVSDSLRKEETTLDAYYNTDEAKGDLKHEFEKAVYDFKDHLYEVKHFNDSLEKEQPSVEINRTDKEQVAYMASKPFFCMQNFRRFEL